MNWRNAVALASCGVLLFIGLALAACGGDGDGDGARPTATADVGGDDRETPRPTATAAATDDGSGDGGSALEEYFQQLDEAENAYRVAGDSADAQLAALDETTLDDAPGIFQEIKVAIDEFVAALQAMDPPAEAVTPHEETIAGFQAASDLIEEALPAIEAAQTVADVFAPLTSPEFTEISTALEATCAALQSIADTNSVAVDLACDR